MMRAIFKNKLHEVLDIDEGVVILSPDDTAAVIEVEQEDPDLVLDPSDEEALPYEGNYMNPGT
tara:strand:- start:510 stop:698 length:189 start_codon:yes stop_codon:yes gene_type:complete